MTCTVANVRERRAGLMTLSADFDFDGETVSLRDAPISCDTYEQGIEEVVSNVISLRRSHLRDCGIEVDEIALDAEVRNGCNGISLEVTK